MSFEKPQNLIFANAKKVSKEVKPFRISAKRIFLTYSQVPEELTSQEIKLQLCSTLKVNRYLIAEERHQDGGKHFHVLLECKTKFNITNARFLDILFDYKYYHGNYQSARDYKSIARYATKDECVDTNYPNFCDGEFLSVEEDMIRQLSNLDEHDASVYYLKNYPTHALKGMSIRNSKKYLSAVKDTLEHQLQEKQPNPISTPFKFQDFRIPPSVVKWIEQGFQPSLMLVGEGGTGKTAFCKVLAATYKWNLLICNHLEGLKALTPRHDAILYDDFSFKGIDNQQLLALVATDETKQVRVLNGAVKKPSGIKQMFTINNDILKKIVNKLKHTQYQRRLVLEKLEEPMIINLNINIDVQKHTNIFNNPETIKRNAQILESI